MPNKPQNDLSNSASNNVLIASHLWMSLYRGYRNEPYISADDGVMVVPVNQSGEVLLIHEPTIFSAQPVLFLPGGAIDQGETPLEAANRELQEEIGYRAEQLDLLHCFYPMARHVEMRVYVVLARNLKESWLVGDEPYRIPLMPFPLKDFDRLLVEGQLRDSTAIAALYLARGRV